MMMIASLLVVVLSASLVVADTPMHVGIEPYSVSSNGASLMKRQAGICENPNFESCDATLVRENEEKRKEKNRFFSKFFRFFSSFLLDLHSKGSMLPQRTPMLRSQRSRHSVRATQRQVLHEQQRADQRPLVRRRLRVLRQQVHAGWCRVLRDCRRLA
jgi:hypothetical protein